MVGHTVGALVDRLRATPGDRVLGPEDAGFAEAVRVANLSLDSAEPLAYIECGSESSVQQAVRRIGEAGIPLAVRSGNFSVAGLGSVDGGVVVSVARLTDIDVDPASGQVRIGAGVRSGQLEAALAASGLCLSLPVPSAPSVIGAALSGGVGYMLRKSGFLCDSLVAARIVTADGDIVEADDQRTPELMWGLRGGGGNFGIVIDATFQATPTPELTVVRSRYAIEQAPEVLTAVGKWGTTVADEVTIVAMFVNDLPPRSDSALPEQSPCLVLNAIHCGEPSDADAALAPLRALPPALHRMATRTTPLQLRHMAHDHFPHSRFGVRTRSGWLDSLTDVFARQLTDAADSLPPGASIVEVAPLGGAVATPARPSAAPGRDAEFFCNAMALWTEPDHPDEQAWLESIDLPWSRTTGDGVVPGFVSENQLDRATSTYGRNFPQLRDIKRRYDPHNLFRRNLNIIPTDHGVNA